METLVPAVCADLRAGRHVLVLVGDDAAPQDAVVAVQAACGAAPVSSTRVALRHRDGSVSAAATVVRASDVMAWHGVVACDRVYVHGRVSECFLCDLGARLAGDLRAPVGLHGVRVCRRRGGNQVIKQAVASGVADGGVHVFG